MRLRRSVGGAARGVLLLRERLALASHAGGPVALVGAGSSVSSGEKKSKYDYAPCFDIALFYVALAEETTCGTCSCNTCLCVLLGITRGAIKLWSINQSINASGGHRSSHKRGCARGP
jgi:hypothetical protein